MMGLLGNVAEVKSLRHRLMTTEFINVFSTLLESCSDGIEVTKCPLKNTVRLVFIYSCIYQVSYNAAGVLAHIASDGVETWTIESPTRQAVLSRMTEAIQRWGMFF